MEQIIVWLYANLKVLVHGIADADDMDLTPVILHVSTNRDVLRQCGKRDIRE